MSLEASSLKPHSFATIANDLSVQAKKSRIGKHVAWLKEPDHKVGKRSLALLESIALASTGVGLYVLWKARRISKQLDAYAAIAKKDGDLSAPPPFSNIEMKTDLATFNHVNDYAIHDGKLWFKPRSQPASAWQPFYFEGWAKDRIPVSLRADGANLMVLDDRGEIHYKKVLKEWLDKSDQYHYQDSTKEDNWKKYWFTLPIVGKVLGFIRPRPLKLPSDIKAWTMCHRGDFVHHFEDIDRREHPEFSTVTTVLTLSKDGKNIRYADPFLPFDFNHKMDGPKDPNFSAEAISASASTIFLKGTTAVTQEVKLYTRLADFDLIRKNPFLPGYWTKHMVPDQEWQEQPSIPLSGQAKLTNEITIFQDGRGNKARELRVKGTNPDGEWGYYSKHIHELDSNAWKFSPFPA
jgi:hypothetical protein